MAGLTAGVKVADIIQRFILDTSGVSAATRTLDDGLARTTQRMASQGRRMSTYLTVPFIGMAAVGTNAFADLEKRLNVITEITGVGQKGFGAFEKKAIDLGKAMDLPGVQAMDAALAMEELAKAGFTTEQTMTAAKGALQFMVAAEMDAGSAAQFMANALITFNLKAEDSARVANALVAGANASTMSVEELAVSFRQSGLNAETFGLSIEEAVAAIAVLSNAGLQGSTAGTQLRMMLQKITSPTDKARKVFDELGVKVKDSNDRMLPMTDILKQFYTQFKKADLARQVKTLNEVLYDPKTGQEDPAWTKAREELGMTRDELELTAGSLDQLNKIFEVRGGSAARALINSYSKAGDDIGMSFDTMVAKIENDKNAVDRLLGAMMRGVAGEIERFKNQWETLQINFGKVMQGPVKAGLKFLYSAFEKFNNMSESGQKWTVLILGIIAAMGPLLIVIAKGITVFRTIASVFNRGGAAAGRVAAQAAAAGNAASSGARGVGRLSTAFTSTRRAANLLLNVLQNLPGAIGNVNSAIPPHIAQLQLLTKAYNDAAAAAKNLAGSAGAVGKAKPPRTPPSGGGRGSKGGGPKSGPSGGGSGGSGATTTRKRRPSKKPADDGPEPPVAAPAPTRTKKPAPPKRKPRTPGMAMAVTVDESAAQNTSTAWRRGAKRSDSGALITSAYSTSSRKMMSDWFDTEAKYLERRRKLFNDGARQRAANPSVQLPSAERLALPAPTQSAAQMKKLNEAIRKQNAADFRRQAQDVVRETEKMGASASNRLFREVMRKTDPLSKSIREVMRTAVAPWPSTAKRAAQLSAQAATERIHKEIDLAVKNGGVNPYRLFEQTALNPQNPEQKLYAEAFRQRFKSTTGQLQSDSKIAGDLAAKSATESFNKAVRSGNKFELWRLWGDVSGKNDPYSRAVQERFRNNVREINKVINSDLKGIQSNASIQKALAKSVYGGTGLMSAYNVKSPWGQQVREIRGVTTQQLELQESTRQTDRTINSMVNRAVGGYRQMIGVQGETVRATRVLTSSVQASYAAPLTLSEALQMVNTQLRLTQPLTVGYVRQMLMVGDAAQALSTIEGERERRRVQGGRMLLELLMGQERTYLQLESAAMKAQAKAVALEEQIVRIRSMAALGPGTGPMPVYAERVPAALPAGPTQRPTPGGQRYQDARAKLRDSMRGTKATGPVLEGEYISAQQVKNMQAANKQLVVFQQNTQNATRAAAASQPIISHVADVADDFGQSAQRGGAGAGAMNAALMALSVGGMYAGGGLGEALSMASMVGMFFTSGPWGLVIGAVVAGAVLVIKNWDKVKEFFSDLWDFIKASAGTAWEAVKAGAKWAFDGVRTIVSKVWDTFTLPGKLAKAGADAARMMGKNFTDGVGGVIRKAGEFVHNMFEGGFNAISSFASGLWRGFTNVVSGTVGKITKWISDNLIGNSPPPEGPLSKIDKGGQNIMEAWVGGMGNASLKPMTAYLEKSRAAFKAVQDKVRDDMRLAEADASRLKRGIDDIDFQFADAFNSIDDDARDVARVLARLNKQADEIKLRFDEQTKQIRSQLDELENVETVEEKRKRNALNIQKNNLRTQIVMAGQNETLKDSLQKQVESIDTQLELLDLEVEKKRLQNEQLAIPLEDKLRELNRQQNEQLLPLQNQIDLYQIQEDKLKDIRDELEYQADLRKRGLEKELDLVQRKISLLQEEKTLNEINNPASSPTPMGPDPLALKPGETPDISGVPQGDVSFPNIDTTEPKKKLSEFEGDARDLIKKLGLYAGDSGTNVKSISQALLSMESAGMSSEDAMAGFEEAAKRIKDGKYEETFKKYGINVKDASGQMLPIADILKQIEDRNLTAAEAFDLFGEKGGAAMIAVANAEKPLDQIKNDMMEVSKVASEQPGFLDRAAEAMRNWGKVIKGEGITGIGKMLDSIMGGLPSKLLGFVTKYLNIPSMIMNLLGMLPGNIGNFFMTLPDKIGGFITSLPGRIGEFLSTMPSTIANAFSSGIESVVTFFTELPGRIWNAIVNFPETLRTWIDSFFATFWTWIYRIQTFFTVDLPYYLGVFIGWIGGIATSVWEAVPKIYNAIVEWLGKAWDWIYKTTADVYNGIIKWLSDTFNGVVNWLSQIWTGFTDWLGRVWQSVQDWFGRIYNTAMKWMGDFLNDPLKALSDLWNGFTNWLGRILDTIGRWAGDLIDLFSGIWDSVANWVSSIWDALADAPEASRRAKVKARAKKDAEQARQHGRGLSEGLRKGFDEGYYNSPYSVIEGRMMKMMAGIDEIADPQRAAKAGGAISAGLNQGFDSNYYNSPYSQMEGAMMRSAANMPLIWKQASLDKVGGAIAARMTDGFDQAWSGTDLASGPTDSVMSALQAAAAMLGDDADAVQSQAYAWGEAVAQGIQDGLDTLSAVTLPQELLGKNLDLGSIVTAGSTQVDNMATTATKVADRQIVQTPPPPAPREPKPQPVTVNNVVNLNVDKMEVRNDQDIVRISQELEALLRRQQRNSGSARV